MYFDMMHEGNKLNRNGNTKQADYNSPDPIQPGSIPDTQADEKALVPYDPLQLYLREIQKYDLLTREEERELAIRVREKNDKKAAYRLITSNLRLVLKFAMELQWYWTERVLDLIQEGNLGLLQAVRKFDPYRGVKFSYYASFWIKAYMLKFIMSNWKLVKIGTTQDQRRLFFSLSREREKLMAQGLTPETELLAERLDVSEEKVVEMSHRLKGKEASLDSPLAEDSRESLYDRLPEQGKDVDDRLSDKQHQEILMEKVKEFRKTLSDRDADVFDKRIIAEEPVTLQKLGDRYSISRERVRQIEKKIKGDLKRRLAEEIPDFEEEYSDSG